MHPVNKTFVNYNYDGWCGSYSYSLPHQGWKIHISATIKNYQTVLNHVAFLSRKFGFSFKYASSASLIDSLLDIHGSRINGGKLMTIYPKNEEHCRQILHCLYRFLRNFHGPIVLTDAQFKGTTNISYRYGLFVVIDEEYYLYHDGKKYLDKKEPYFLLPPFIDNDPFAKDALSSSEPNALWNDISLDYAIQFSLGGGVYSGSYLNKYPVILKEARFDIGTNIGSAIDKRKNEHYILSLLNGEYFPKYITEFYSQNNYYLVTEAIPGMTYYDYFCSLGPLVVAMNQQAQAMADFIDIIKQIGKLITYAHSKNVILRDIKPSNFIITDKNKVFFIDCADSVVGNQKKYLDQIRTPGYIIPNSLYNTFAEDWFKLALLIIDALSGINRNLAPATFTQVFSMFSKALASQGFSKIWLDIIMALSQNDIDKFEAYLNDPQLGVLTPCSSTYSPKESTYDFLGHKDFIANWLYKSLSSTDQLLFDQLNKSDQSKVITELDKLLGSFTIKNGLAYRKVGNDYSPYVYGGSAGLAYIILYFCDKYHLSGQLEVLKNILTTLKGRYAKSAAITTGVAGISLMLIYASIVTKSAYFLQLALSWDEYIDILAFEVGKKKVWCNGVLSSKYDPTLYADAYEIQKFQQLLHDPNSQT